MNLIENVYSDGVSKKWKLFFSAFVGDISSQIWWKKLENITDSMYIYVQVKICKKFSDSYAVGIFIFNKKID